MALILSLNSGIAIHRKQGEQGLIGRAVEKPEFALPEDRRMSGVHFAVECGPHGCRVIDLNSRNGTFLNGNRIQEAILASGDEIRAGDTVFLVKIVPDDQLPDVAVSSTTATPLSRDKTPQQDSTSTAAPRPALSNLPARQSNGEHAQSPGKPPQAAANHRSSPSGSSKPTHPLPDRAGGRSLMPTLSIMGWSFFHTPENWEVKEGVGLQRAVKDEFPSRLTASKELLGRLSLKEFVDAQTGMLSKYLNDAKVEAIKPPRVGAAEETLAVDVRYSTKDGKEIVFRRIYAKNGGIVGVLNVSSMAADLPRIIDSLNPLFADVAFLGGS